MTAREVVFAALFVAPTLLLAEKGSAWEFRTRLVERVGNTDIPIANNILDATDVQPTRVRLQIGMFDDDSGPAPAGGLVGMVDGVIEVLGDPNNSDETRTPGRLAPFNQSNDPPDNGDPPLPGGDPFTVLTEINARFMLQAHPWLCGPDGQPLPMPQPTVRGLNSFVSIYEITVDPADVGSVDYAIRFSGSLVATTEWIFLHTPVPPECDPPTPGFVTYVPLLPNDFGGFQSDLTVLVPAPGALCVGAPLWILALRRRRP